MDRIKKSRKAARTAVTKTVNAIEAELAKEEPDVEELEMLLQTLEENSESLVDLNAEVMDALLDGNRPDEEIEAEGDSVQEYGSKIKKARNKLNKILRPRSPSPATSVTSFASASVGGGKKTYKLPKIEMKKFSGDLTEWLGWWSQFKKIDEDTDLHESDKFQYLIQSMTPGSEARALVDRYPQTSENYPKVIVALKERFGEDKLLRQVYIRELIKMIINKSIDKSGKVPLSTLYDQLYSHLQSLDSLGKIIDASEFLFPMVESSLPQEVLGSWQHSPLHERDGSTEDPPRSKLDFLMEFLKKEIKNEQERKLADSDFGLGATATKKDFRRENHKKFQEKIPTAAGLFNADTKSLCFFCDKRHDTDKCVTAQNMSLEDKRKKLNNKRACHHCFKTNHASKDCKTLVKCFVCGQKHHSLLCPGKSQSKPKQLNPTAPEFVTTTTTNLDCTNEIILQTLMVRVKNEQNGKTKLVRALIDTGSQRSYMLKSTAEKLGFQSEKKLTLHHILFGGNHVAAQVHNVLDVGFYSTSGDFSQMIQLLDSEQICGIIPRATKGPWLSELKGKKIRLNDINPEDPMKIEVLLGADNSNFIRSARFFSLSNGLTAIETPFGWTLMGQMKMKETSTALNVISMHFTSASVSDLWNLETIGINDPAESKSRLEKELAAKEHFKETVSRDVEGRYSVSLPWIGGKQDIPDNRAVAEKRLESTTKKLISQGNFNKYQDIFDDWEKEGIVSLCPPMETEDLNYHYIPHRAVLKPESKTTPVRPVFDASCKVGRSPSLNECLEKGPNLLELIPSILLRFRIGKIGFISDIRKAFLMIDVKEDDRRFLRFLWWEDYEKRIIKILQHNRVVFGMNCSPFLLGAVIEHHLENVGDDRKTIAEKLGKSLYVDNCVASVDNLQQYEEFKTVSTELMAEAKMELRQWEFTGDDPIQNCTSVLGMKWDKEADCLFCAPLDGEIPEKITKRVILSRLQQVFDPLGFLSPAVLKPKFLLQKSWSEKSSWDEELPAEMKKEFEDWYSEIVQITDQFRIPRNCTGGAILKGNLQIHVFSDASALAYAAIIFLRVETEDGVSVQLLQAKSRVAPLKPVTIPRLELLGCNIASRLTVSVMEALKFQDIPIFYWTDSTTALAWITRNNEWGTFVGNRVREICSLTDSQQWRHVPGILNPADLPSRGCSPKKLLESRWWEGPDWLKQTPDEWPSGEGVVDEELVLRERKKTVVMTCLVQEEECWWNTKYSSYIQNLRVVALVFRALEKFKKNESETDRNVTTDEIDKAELKMLLMIQQQSFLQNQTVVSGLKVMIDKDGLYRVKTKLTYRKDTEGFRFPILLPNAHPVIDKMIREEHYCNGHPGVQYMMGALREKYWIIYSRKAIKRIVKSCVICKKFSEKSRSVPPAPLPEDRVTSGRIFDVTGVDLGGPMILSDRSKCWFVIFTCAQYRGVHLELVKSLDTEAFLAAWTRFVCRRRRPKTVYSDNGTNFRGSVNLFKHIDWNAVREKTRQERVQWKFNPPSAPWWGGWWESLIGSVKELLKRMLGTSTLTYVQLETCLCKVEQLMNNRPLCFVTNDPEDLQTLTPAMFMNDLSTAECPEAQLLTVPGLQSKYKNMEILFDELRSRFRQEYLAQMAQRGKDQKHEVFKVGDMVWIGAENKKRIEWPMARILELFPGKDGQTRVARVRTREGELVRPLQRLYPTGVSSYVEFSTVPSDPIKKAPKKVKVKEKVVVSIPEEPKIFTKSGRQVKKPVWLDDK